MSQLPETIRVSLAAIITNFRSSLFSNPRLDYRQKRRTEIHMVKAVDREVQVTDAQRYMRPRDVMDTTRLSKSVVMNAIWSGRLEAYRVGRTWVIPVEAVDRWIQGEGEHVA